MSGSLTFENMELKLLLEREFLIYTGSFDEAEYGKARRPANGRRYIWSSRHL